MLIDPDVVYSVFILFTLTWYNTINPVLDLSVYCNCKLLLLLEAERGSKNVHRFYKPTTVR